MKFLHVEGRGQDIGYTLVVAGDTGFFPWHHSLLTKVLAKALIEFTLP